MTQYAFLTPQIKAHMKWRHITFRQDIWILYDRKILTNIYQRQGIHECVTKKECRQIKLKDGHIFLVSAYTYIYNRASRHFVRKHNILTQW